MNGNSVSPALLKNGNNSLGGVPQPPLPPSPPNSTINSTTSTTTVSPETNSINQLGQQLLCMNNLLTISNSNGNSNNNSNNSSGPQVFNSKEQLAEQYQLAKMRLNQDLLGASAFYSAAAAFPAYAYAASPYAETVGGGKMGSHLLVPNGFHHRFRYGSHPLHNPHHHPHHHHHLHHHEDPKPQHSYIGLIAMAILSMPDQKMVLSDIYQHILDHYPYFRNRGPGWRNSIRHNLSLNDCFIKSGRSANGKGHYWAIHPANLEDFRKGDFRRRKAQRKVRKHMGLSVPDDEEDDDDESPGASPVPGVGGILSAEKAAVAAAAAAAACAAGNLLSSPGASPNPFVQAISSSPMFQLNSAAANPAQCFSAAQAFNFFNSLRFAAALPQPPQQPPSSGTGGFQAVTALPFPSQTNNVFNETLYRQLINLNIKQDLQSAVNRVSAAAAARKGCSEFSIESLLSQHNQGPEQNHNYVNGLHHPHFNHQHLQLHQRTASTEESDVDSETEGTLCRGGKGNDSELSVEEEVITSTSLNLKCDHGIKQQHMQPVNLKIN